MTKTLACGYSNMRVLSDNYPMNTNMRGLGVFQKSLRPCSLDEGSLSIGWVKSCNMGSYKCTSSKYIEISSIQKDIMLTVRMIWVLWA